MAESINITKGITSLLLKSLSMGIIDSMSDHMLASHIDDLGTMVLCDSDVKTFLTNESFNIIPNGDEFIFVHRIKDNFLISKRCSSFKQMEENIAKESGIISSDPQFVIDYLHKNHSSFVILTNAMKFNDDELDVLVKYGFLKFVIKSLIFD